MGWLLYSNAAPKLDVHAVILCIKTQASVPIHFSHIIPPPCVWVLCIAPPRCPWTTDRLQVHGHKRIAGSSTALHAGAGTRAALWRHVCARWPLLFLSCDPGLPPPPLHWYPHSSPGSEAAARRALWAAAWQGLQTGWR